MVETSVVPAEVQQFGKLAADWWDPRGASAMLHKLNPVRLAYIRDWIDQHWSLDEHSRRPLEGKSALDVGCGAGLLAEPLARLGAAVTAIDPAGELIAAARDHAGGGCRRNPQGHARLRQVHCAGPDEAALGQRRPELPGRRRTGFQPHARPSPQRRRQPELPG